MRKNRFGSKNVANHDRRSRKYLRSRDARDPEAKVAHRRAKHGLWKKI